MTLALTLSDMLMAAGVIIPLSCTGLYLAVRAAIKSEVKDLELRITQAYQSKATCREIRAECEQHRADMAKVAGGAAAAAPHAEGRRGRQ